MRARSESLPSAASNLHAARSGNANAVADDGHPYRLAQTKYSNAPLPWPVPLLSAPGGSQGFHGLDDGSLRALTGQEHVTSTGLAGHCRTPPISGIYLGSSLALVAGRVRCWLRHQRYSRRRDRSIRVHSLRTRRPTRRLHRLGVGWMKPCKWPIRWD
jgi:hypothetical protein